MTDNTEAIHVVLGLDSDGKPHASRFPEAEADAARRAAGLMGFSIIEVREPEPLLLAQELPPGRTYATGRALVPFVRRELYDKLVALLPAEVAPVEAPPASSAEEPAAEAPAEVPAEVPATTEPPPPAADAQVPPVFQDYWAAVEIGSIVLAMDRKSDEGWWKCEIIGIGKDGDRLTARWIDFPEEGTFHVNRRAVAILAGGVAPAKRK